MKDPSPTTIPDVFERINLPQANEYDGKPFPLCLTPSLINVSLRTDPSAAIACIKENRDTIESLLQEHSVILFRGFASTTSTPVDFATFVSDALNLPNFPYVGGNAVRTSIVGDRVFTANESPPSKPIPFHHELAQTPNYPRRLLFYCEQPAETGGETPILYSPAVYKDLSKRHPEFVQRLEEHGVIYSRVMTADDRPHSAIGRGWHRTFAANNRAEVEEKLTEKGYSWEWIGDGEDAMLREISPVLPAVKILNDGRKSFLNQISAVWGGWRDEFNTPQKCLTCGDGLSMDADAMDDLARIMNDHKVAIPWERGDIMYIDNLAAQHSRNSFTGRRRVLASLAK